MYRLVLYFNVIELISFVDESLKLKLREKSQSQIYMLGARDDTHAAFFPNRFTD